MFLRLIWTHLSRTMTKGQGRGPKKIVPKKNFFWPKRPNCESPGRFRPNPGTLGQNSGTHATFTGRQWIFGAIFFYGTLSTCHNCPSFDPRPVPLTFLLKSTTVECITAVVKFPGHWNVPWQTKIPHLVEFGVYLISVRL